MTTIAAIYARYSSDNQRDTSLEDQVRRCRQLAEQHGLTVVPSLIFTDAAMSGTKASRPGYQALLAAWEQGQFQALLLDTQSRLFRDEVEAAVTKKRIRESRVRVLCASGMDTGAAGWELLWTFQSGIDAEYVRHLAFNVKRGMDGALLRGAMVTRPPYGYRNVRVLDDDKRHLYSTWEVNEAQAEVIREIFQARASGASVGSITRSLNERGIPAAAGGLWAVATIWSLLSNPVYMGVLEYGASRGGKCRKTQASKNKGRTEQFERPELAIVDSETFQRVQKRSSGLSVSGRGGGVHWYSSLVQHVCGGTFFHSGRKRKRARFFGRLWRPLFVHFLRPR